MPHLRLAESISGDEPQRDRADNDADALPRVGLLRSSRPGYFYRHWMESQIGVRRYQPHSEVVAVTGARSSRWRLEASCERA
jgi:hypothetical protein